MMMNRSRINSTMMATALVSSLLLPTTIAFAPPTVQNQNHPASSSTLSRSRPIITTTTTPLQMSLEEVSDFYADFPLQAAVLTCGVKASVADGIAQTRTLLADNTNNDDSSTRRSKALQLMDDLELRRNIAYIIYGGIFIGAMCHYEYDVIFPILFGTQHSLLTSLQEVLFDNFVSAPLMWLPPAYLIKAVVYDYSLQEGLQKYVHDVKENGLLLKYWTIWVPAQSVSFTVVPDHLRVVFMASVSFFWFILFSTVSSSSESSSGSSNESAAADEVNA